jgi:hypothetical protein
MRHQPPDNNNPATPLLKVAALNLDKEYESGSKRAKIIVNLVFKRSNDLRGRTQAKDGRQVTVTFGLALKRASFKLVFATENDLSASRLVKIGKVAFVAPLALKNRISDVLAVTEEASRSLSLAGSGTLGITSAGGFPGAKASAKGEISSGRAAKGSRRVSRRFEKTNVTATFGGA